MNPTEWQRLKPCLELYPIHVIRVQPLAPGRFRVDSSDRSYEGRLVSAASASVRQGLSDYVAQRSFRSTQRFLLNMYHDRVVPLADGDVFYLTDAWQSPSLQVTHDDVRLAVQNLVSLHQAMTGFLNVQDEPVRPVRKRYGTWQGTFEQGAQWIATERILAKSKRGTPGGMEWFDWVSRWEEQAQSAVTSLQDAGYRHLAEASEDNRDLAWNDYRLGNLVQRTAGKLATLQTQDPVGDSSMYDLASVCQEICAAGHADGVEEAIAQYHAERPLSAEQKQVVRSFAAYPHHALTTLRKVRMDKAVENADFAWRKTAEHHWGAARALLAKSH